MNRQSDKTTALYCRLASFTEADILTAKLQRRTFSQQNTRWIDLRRMQRKTGSKIQSSFVIGALAAQTQSARNTSECSIK